MPTIVHYQYLRWKAGLTTVNFDAHADVNHHNIASMSEHSKNYNSRIKEEDGKTAEELLVANVGKIDPKRHLVILYHFVFVLS